MDLLLYNSWFTGYCQTCKLNIRDKSHCVRFPDKDGGWLGCYCSLSCMKNNDQYPTDELFPIRYETLQNTLKLKGIYNRYIKHS